MNTQTGFDLYLVSMAPPNKRTPIALDRVRSQFGKLPVVVSGPNLGEGQYGRLWPRVDDKLKPGEVGCATGHCFALLKFLESGSPHCYIMEDDIMFIKPAEWFDLCLYEVRHLDFNWSWMHTGGRQYDKAVIPHPELRPYPEGARVARANLCGWATAGYFVSRAGAISLLNRCTPLMAAYDVQTRFPSSDDRAFNTLEDGHQQDQSFQSFVGGKNPIVWPYQSTDWPACETV